jgi:hypothetical protein
LSGRDTTLNEGIQAVRQRGVAVGKGFPYSVFQQPAFEPGLAIPGQYPSDEAYAQAARRELAGRYTQDVHFKRLVARVPEVQEPDHMIILTRAFAYVRYGARQAGEFKPLGYHQLLPALFERVGEIHMDPEEGTASPQAIADFMRPSIQTALDDRDLARAHERQNPSGIGFNQSVASAMQRLTDGSAEQVAGGRLRAYLHENRYPGFRPTESSKTIMLRVGDEYLTMRALRHMRENGLFKKGGMPEGKAALYAASDMIYDTIEELAGEGYSIAGQLLEAYTQLGLPHTVARRRAATAYQNHITLANIVTPELNKRGKLRRKKDQLNQLDLQQFEDLPIAFQRLLSAVDPRLLANATTGSIFEGNPLRLRMSYIEALGVQWAEHRNRPIAIGNVLLRLLAEGALTDEIRQVASEAAPSGDESTVMTYRRITRDWRVKTGRTKRARTKPGWGVLS